MFVCVYICIFYMISNLYYYILINYNIMLDNNVYIYIVTGKAKLLIRQLRQNDLYTYSESANFSASICLAIVTIRALFCRLSNP